MKKDLPIALLAILLVAAVTFALDRTFPDKPLTPSHPFEARAAGAGPAAVKEGKVVMRVNGEPVTEAEVNAFAQSVPEEQRAFLSSNPQGKRMLANEIVKLKMLEQEARRLGVSGEPEVQTQLEMTSAQIMASRALEKIVKPKLEAYVRAEFEKERKDSINLRHIVVAYSGGQIPARDGSARPPAQAEQKARAIASRLRGGGADFAELARAESDDQQTAMNGGSLGAVNRAMLPPEIATVIAKLQPGQISDPVRTPLGYHIFRTDAPSLEEMRPALMRRAQQQVVMETIEALQKQAKVDFDPGFFPPAPQSPAPPRRGTLPATQ